MDTLFRKKKSRNLNDNDPNRSLPPTSSQLYTTNSNDRSSQYSRASQSNSYYGDTPGTASSSSTSSYQMSISGPSSNPHVSKQGRNGPYLSPSGSSAQDFNARGHSRTSSGMTAAAAGLAGPSSFGYPNQYDPNSNTPSSSSSRQANSRSSRNTTASNHSDTNSIHSVAQNNGSMRLNASTNDILNRMSLASASAASLTMPWSADQQQQQQSSPSMSNSNSTSSAHGQHYPHPSNALAPRQPSANYAQSYGSPAHQRPPAPGEFQMNRPADVEVERMFAELMDRRDFLRGNAADKEDIRRNMLMFHVDKKWALVYNDRLTEWMSSKERERNRRQLANSHQPGQARGPIITRNSPEWFITKFMDGTVTTKDIESLAVTLRTCAIGWIQSFVDAKGTPVLASFLNGLHAKQVRSDNDIALEYEVLKAFRSLFNSKSGANDALAQPKCISGIARSMISNQLGTRKQAADILLFLCHWEKPSGHRLVLQGFDDIKSSQNDHGRFDAWFRVLEQTIDGRGTMGSRVNASEEVKKLSILGPQESSLNEYAINNMFLINAILAPEVVSEFEIRVHLRNQMEASGLQRILIKMKAFKNQDLDAQIAAFENSSLQDHEDVVETFNKDVLTDMSDPVDVFKAIVEKVSGSRAYDFFLSSLQHLLLIRQEGDHLVHWYQLIDSLVTSVVMDRKGAVESSDISSLLGTSVNNVLSRFADQDHMQTIQSELQRFKAEARSAEQERAKLQAQLEQESEGLVGKLQGQITALEEDLEVSRGNALALQRDLEDMEKGYIDRIVALEVQNREIYEMMRENADKKDIFPDGKESLDRQAMVDTLERQLERERTIRKLEANARKEGRPLPSSGPEREAAIKAEETKAQRERISMSVRRESTRHRDASQDSSGAEQRLRSSVSDDDEHLADADDQEESDLEPTSEAAKWKIQATLAAGMAQNANLAERMHDARATRRKKGSMADGDAQTLQASTSKGQLDSVADVGDETITASQANVSADDVPPPPPPPPPMPSTSGGSSFLDEIRKGRALRSAESNGAASQITSDMGPPPAPPAPPPPMLAPPVSLSNEGRDIPPPPPPPPPPGALQSAFSPADTPISSRPDSFASDAPPPPPPPPPPGAAGMPMTLPGTPASVRGAGAAPDTPASAASGYRDSMLNMRASYAGDIGPAGPAAAPPPPPMAGFFGNQMTTRKEVLEMAKTRMKQLQWDKLSPQHAAETVWGQNPIADEELTAVLRSEGLFEEMEEDFKAKQTPKRQAQAAKKDKVEFKTHLSFQTRQGIEMVLRRVRSSLTDAKHATPEEVAHHIVNCNEVVLDQSFLTELLRHYPESETKGQLGEYRNASDEELRLLHPADRLVVLLMTVPHLKEKVKGLLFMTKYKEAYDLVKEGGVKIRDGSEGLVQAQNFAKLLGIILMMGNYLNATGVQGGAFGFKISSINKLVDTKASDGTTLLHFVERTVSKAFPEVEAFLDELESPSEACRVQLLDLKRELAELKSGSLQHKKELDRFIDEDESHLQDPYTKLMLPFLNDAGSQLSRLSDQVQFTERTYVDALRYFGEGPDPKRRGFPAAQPMRTEDFFGIFREFSTAYRKVKVDNVRIGEQRSLEAKRRAAAEEREKERLEALARKEAGVDDSLVLETLLGNLRSRGGTPKNKRKARERGAARRAKDSMGSTGGDGVTSGSGGDPSEMAQALLAKLQGGAAESGGEGGSEAATTEGVGTTSGLSAEELLAQTRAGAASPLGSNNGGGPNTSRERLVRRRDRRTLGGSDRGDRPRRDSNNLLRQMRSDSSTANPEHTGGIGGVSQPQDVDIESDPAGMTPRARSTSILSGGDSESNDTSLAPSAGMSHQLSQDSHTSSTHTSATRPSMSEDDFLSAPEEDGDDKGDQEEEEEEEEQEEVMNDQHDATFTPRISQPESDLEDDDEAEGDIGAIEWIDPDSSGFGRHEAD
ncbi:unnamed protein product [Sympodiomycopsis kandeliae]